MTTKARKPVTGKKKAAARKKAMSLRIVAASARDAIVKAFESIDQDDIDKFVKLVMQGIEAYKKYKKDN